MTYRSHGPLPEVFIYLALKRGFEPLTPALTERHSTIELLENGFGGRNQTANTPFTYNIHASDSVALLGALIRVIPARRPRREIEPSPPVRQTGIITFRPRGQLRSKNGLGIKHPKVLPPRAIPPKARVKSRT
jgi:hypothetical protein